MFECIQTLADVFINAKGGLADVFQCIQTVAGGGVYKS